MKTVNVSFFLLPRKLTGEGRPENEVTQATKLFPPIRQLWPIYQNQREREREGKEREERQKGREMVKVEKYG